MAKAENIQNLIDQKARDKAEKAVALYIRQMKENKDVHELFERYYFKIGEGVITIREALWDTNRKIPSDIIETLTKKYVPIESKLFFDKIENMQEQLDDILNQRE